MRKIGLVGCGAWGSKILRDLLHLDCEVLVADTDADARHLASEMGASATFPKAADLPDCDGYVVAVLIPDLCGVSAGLLKRGKPIFAEKTLCTSMTDYDYLKSLGGKEFIFPMHKWHYHPGIEALRKASQSRRIGEVLEISTTRHGWVDDFHGGDVFWTLCVHDLTIIKHILGYIPREIRAIHVSHDEKGLPVRLSAMIGEEPVANISVSGRHVDKLTSVGIHGKRGCAILHDAYSDHIAIRDENGEEKLPIDTTFPLFLELKEFVEFLRGGPKPRCGIEEAREVTETLLHFREASLPRVKHLEVLQRGTPLNKRPRIFAPSKVAIHKEKIDSYLKGENIFPVTVEIDLTQRCTRSCPACPYSVSRRAGLTLEMPFLERVLGILGPHTPGIVLSGGEATLVPHFPRVLALAKASGFREIAIISNGSRLHVPEVQAALLEHATSIRVSMYDWQQGDSEYFSKTLKKIEHLRTRIEKEGSEPEIGAGILTRKEWSQRLADVGRKALNAGVDWVYFHPFCVDWDTERPTQADQTGVIEAIEEFKRTSPPAANIQVPYERYSRRPLRFEKLHGAHFLIQVGADGVNYAGPEGKYEDDFRLLDLNEYPKDDFLWHPSRLERLGEFSSDNYRIMGTRHRPPVFSDYIEALITGSRDSDADAGDDFSYPDII
jgi:predicted dehydrogenase